MAIQNEPDGDEVQEDEFQEDYEEEEVQPVMEYEVSETDDVSEIDPEKMGAEGQEYLTLQQRKQNLMKTAEILEKHDVVVQKLINKARDDLVWEQYMKCDGLPDPVCVRELNTYLCLWKEDNREDIDKVLERTLEVLPIMSTLENLIENPDEWEVPIESVRKSRSYKSKVQERQTIFNEMKRMQLQKLNRATYNLLLDVSPMVDTESNVLQHFLTSELVSLGLWGNVMAKNMRVKGTNFESLGFGFELPQSLMGTVGAVRVMRVDYDHYSPMCKSNKMPPRAKKDIPTYIECLDERLKELENFMQERKIQMKREQAELEAIQRAREEEEREKARLAKLERKTKTKTGAAAGAAASGAGKLANQAQSEDVGEKDAQPATTEDDLAASAAATAAGAAAQTAPGSSKEKDTQKEVMQERIDLYSTAHDENELNLRRNTILGTVC